MGQPSDRKGQAWNGVEAFGVSRCIVWSCLLIVASMWLNRPFTAYAAQEAEIAYNKGIVAYSNRNYLDALELFRQVVTLEPENPDAQFYLGLTLTRVGEFANAIAALQKALQLDPSKRYIHHHLGLAYFLAKRYDDALAQLQQAAQFAPQKAETQYYLGYTHYLLKQYEQVLEPMQRVIELNAKMAPIARYYQGLALYALERDEQAREAFDTVIAAAPESSEAQNAQRYLDAMQRRVRERRLYQLYGSIAYQYDDNVILEPNGIEISGQADSRMAFSLLGRLIPLRTPQWRAGAEYSLFQSVHFRLSEFDIESHTAGLFARLKLDRVTFRMEANANVTLLDSRLFVSDNLFSRSVTLRPSVTIRQTDSLFAVLSTRLRYSDYYDPILPEQDSAVRDRDGWALRAGVDQFLSFDNQRALVRLSYHYEGNRTDGTDWSYDSHHVGLGLQLLLWEGLTLNADFGYTRFDYLHVNSFSADPLAILTSADTQKRQDDRLIGAIALTQTLGEFFFFTFSVVHTSNLSNIAFFDYDRNIVSLTLTGRY